MVLDRPVAVESSGFGNPGQRELAFDDLRIAVLVMVVLEDGKYAEVHGGLLTCALLGPALANRLAMLSRLIEIGIEGDELVALDDMHPTIEDHDPASERIGDLGEGIGVLLTVSQVFSFYSKFILGMGLVFEIPTLVLVLARIGLVTPRFLWSKFKYAVLLIFVIAAIITPTPDVVTQSLLAFPMIGLYLLSIGIAWVVGRDREIPPSSED